VLQVEQVLHVHDYHSHAGIEVGGPQDLTCPQGAASARDFVDSELGKARSESAVRRLTHKEVSVTCAVYSMVVSGSLPTMIPVHGSARLRGIVMLVSQMSRPSTIDKRPQEVATSPS
jgi:hypothetical protein